MDASSRYRAVSWAAFACLLGMGLGLLLAALWDAWVRLAAGEYHRETLFHVLGLLGSALVAFLASAAAWAWAGRPGLGRREATARRMRVSVQVSR